MIRTSPPRATLAFALALAGCGPGVLKLNVTLFTKSCKADRDPARNVAKLRFTITGDNLPPIVVDNVGFADGKASIPAIPVGSNRHLRVEALDGPSPAGKVVASGDSGPIDASGAQNPVNATVFLRSVNAFSPTNSADDPTQCTHMTSPRAGHTMSLLGDGRVLIAGGISVDSTGNHYLKSAEVYDPKTGKFTPTTTPTSPRAFAAAATLSRSTTPDTVFVSGGEFLSNQVATALKPAETFDASVDNGPGNPLGAWHFSPMKYARSHHSATEDTTGRVLIAGGISSGEVDAPTMVAQLEYFDPAAGSVTPSTAMLSQARANHAAIALSNGMVLLAGGSDGSNNALGSMEAFLFVSSEYARSATLSSLTLTSKHARPAAVRLLDSGDHDLDRVLVAGGFDTTFNVSTRLQHVSTVVEVVDAGANPPRLVVPAPAALTVPRADACVAALSGGGAIVIGGDYSDSSSGMLKSTSTADLYTPATSGAGGLALALVDGPMKDARHLFACLRLADGSVMVSGGLQWGSGGTPTTLDSAEIYQPVTLP